MTMPNLVELMGFETLIAPKDITGAAQVGDWLSMKNYSHATITIKQGTWGGGTPAVTLTQALDVAGTTPKALSFNRRWSKVGLGAGTVFAGTTVTADTFNLPATANTITIIEIDGDDLDVTNGYDCFTINIASPGAFADLLSADCILSGARYGQAAMPDAKVE